MSAHGLKQQMVVSVAHVLSAVLERQRQDLTTAGPTIDVFRVTDAPLTLQYNREFTIVP